MSKVQSTHYRGWYFSGFVPRALTTWVGMSENLNQFQNAGDDNVAVIGDRRWRTPKLLLSRTPPKFDRRRRKGPREQHHQPADVKPLVTRRLVPQHVIRIAHANV